MDTFSKFFACKNHTTQGQKDPCLKSPLAQIFFEFEYLREFETKFENDVG